MLARGCTDNFLPMKHTWTGLDQIYQIDTSIPLHLWKMKLIHSHIISLSNHVFQNISLIPLENRSTSQYSSQVSHLFQ